MTRRFDGEAQDSQPEQDHGGERQSQQRRQQAKSQRPTIFSRVRSSRSATSGVSASPKSAASNTGRISISLGPSIGLGQRFTHAIASAMSLTCQSQNPATNSRVSAEGPSMRVRLGPSKATRLPFADGCKPSPARRMPALTSSSLYLPMASRSSVEGMTPASESFVALTKTITRIVLSPLIPGGHTGFPGHTTDERQIDIRLRRHGSSL